MITRPPTKKQFICQFYLNKHQIKQNSKNEKYYYKVIEKWIMWEHKINYFKLTHYQKFGNFDSSSNYYCLHRVTFINAE